jgi:hypothetical protein
VPHEQHRIVVFGVISIASALVLRNDVELLFVVVIPFEGSLSNNGKGTNKRAIMVVILPPNPLNAWPVTQFA